MRTVLHKGTHEEHRPYSNVPLRQQRQHSHGNARCGRAQFRVAHVRRREWRYVNRLARVDSGVFAQGAETRTARAAARGQKKDARAAVVFRLQPFGL